MKLGQMASYLDDGLPEPVRLALAELQPNAPPMSAGSGGRRGGVRARRAARAAVRRVGSRADRGGVDRPGPPRRVARPDDGRDAPWRSRCSTPASARRSRPTSRNTDLFGAVLAAGFQGFDPAEMVAEIEERVTEELDYEREACQPAALRRLLPRPSVHLTSRRRSTCCRRRQVLTTELATGDALARGADVGPAPSATSPARPLPLRVPQPLPHARVQRRPAPRQLPLPRRRHGSRSSTSGWCATSPRTRSTSSPPMVKASAVDHDAAEYRRLAEHVGLLRPNAPVSTDDVGRLLLRLLRPGRRATAR